MRGGESVHSRYVHTHTPSLPGQFRQPGLPAPPSLVTWSNDTCIGPRKIIERVGPTVFFPPRNDRPVFFFSFRKTFYFFFVKRPAYRGIYGIFPSALFRLDKIVPGTITIRARSAPVSSIRTRLNTTTAPKTVRPYKQVREPSLVYPGGPDWKQPKFLRGVRFTRAAKTRQNRARPRNQNEIPTNYRAFLTRPGLTYGAQLPSFIYIYFYFINRNALAN